MISVSLVSLLLHIDCSPEAKTVKYFNSWDHWQIVHLFQSSRIFVMFCDLHGEKMGEKHLQNGTGLLFYHRLVVLVCPDKGGSCLSLKIFRPECSCLSNNVTVPDTLHLLQRHILKISCAS